jgi:small subunit ribosomal protein S2
MIDIQTQIKELFERGAHYAYSKARRHPSAQEFIFGTKDGVELFDLEKTVEALTSAEDFLKALGSERKQILFVSTKNEARRYVEEAAQILDMPYVTQRWVGGVLTNFKQIRSRVERLEELREDKEKGLLKEKYTKKERLLLDREVAGLEKNFGGIVSMKKLPAAVIIVDSQFEHNATAEIVQKNIPIIALANSDSDLSNITYPIPANDSSHKTIAYVVGRLRDAYKEGLKTATSAPLVGSEK